MGEKREWKFQQELKSLENIRIMNPDMYRYYFPSKRYYSPKRSGEAIMQQLHHQRVELETFLGVVNRDIEKKNMINLLGPANSGKTKLVESIGEKEGKMGEKGKIGKIEKM